MESAMLISITFDDSPFDSFFVLENLLRRHFHHFNLRKADAVYSFFLCLGFGAICGGM